MTSLCCCFSRENKNTDNQPGHHEDNACRERLCKCFNGSKRYENFENEQHQDRVNAHPRNQRLYSWFGVLCCFKTTGDKKDRYEDFSKRNDELQKEINQLSGSYTQLQTRYGELEKTLDKSRKETGLLRNERSKLIRSNDELSRQKDERQQQIDKLSNECNQLRTRLSEMACMQLIDRNPNISDLSDQHRQDKVTEDFGELYDNEWTDCYLDLLDHKLTEEEAIQSLLYIVQTSYNICLERCESLTTDVKNSLFSFAGMLHTESDKALDVLIKETLLSFRSYRTKNFKAAPTSIGMEIKAKLLSTNSDRVGDTCTRFVEKCVNICWLMCIKDPPMYIFCDKEEMFDQTKYVAYTESGPEILYVVWPVLYLYRNGPIMRKGVVQGQKKDE